MRDNIHEKQLYVGILELLKNGNLYYNSPVDQRYSKLTEQGNKALVEFIEAMAPLMLAKEEAEFLDRAKQKVWEGINS
jgi:hypothetical protein